MKLMFRVLKRNTLVLGNSTVFYLMANEFAFNFVGAFFVFDPIDSECFLMLAILHEGISGMTSSEYYSIDELLKFFCRLLTHTIETI